MIPTVEEIKSLHKKYAPNQTVYDLVFGHCQIVADIALWAAKNAKQTESADTKVLEAAALLHDIGTYILFDEHGKVANRRMYPQHAILGAKIIADEDIDARISKLVETHILLGLTAAEIAQRPWALPARDYVPDSAEGELLCYADRFHSKKPVFNSYETFLKQLQTDLPLQAEKFEALAGRFGIPDIRELAKKYGQPIR